MIVKVMKQDGFLMFDNVVCVDIERWDVNVIYEEQEGVYQPIEDPNATAKVHRQCVSMKTGSGPIIVPTDCPVFIMDDEGNTLEKVYPKIQTKDEED